MSYLDSQCDLSIGNLFKTLSRSCNQVTDSSETHRKDGLALKISSLARHRNIGLHTREDANLGGKAKSHKATHAWGRGWISWVHSLRETPILGLWIVPRPAQTTQGQRPGAIHQHLPGYHPLFLLSVEMAG